MLIFRVFTNCRFSRLHIGLYTLQYKNSMYMATKVVQKQGTFNGGNQYAVLLWYLLCNNPVPTTLCFCVSGLTNQVNQMCVSDVLSLTCVMSICLYTWKGLFTVHNMWEEHPTDVHICVCVLSMYIYMCYTCVYIYVHTCLNVSFIHSKLVYQ